MFVFSVLADARMRVHMSVNLIAIVAFVSNDFRILSIWFKQVVLSGLATFSFATYDKLEFVRMHSYPPTKWSDFYSTALCL